MNTRKLSVRYTSAKFLIIKHIKASYFIVMVEFFTKFIVVCGDAIGPVMLTNSDLYPCCLFHSQYTNLGLA